MSIYQCQTRFLIEKKKPQGFVQHLSCFISCIIEYCSISTCVALLHFSGVCIFQSLVFYVVLCENGWKILHGKLEAVSGGRAGNTMA